MKWHYEESIQRDLDQIRAKVQEMSGLVEKALQTSLNALLEKDRQAAYSVILRDQYIDELEKEIDRLCLEFLVRQQPVAGHLRFAYATIKINAELERIGDYAESIARQVLKLGLYPLDISYKHFEAIANQAIPMVHQAVQAFLESDPNLARTTMNIEEEVNSLRDGINVILYQQGKTGKIPIEVLMALVTVARRFERATDQAKNICEETLYMCTGEYVKHHGGGGVLRILFVDDANNCLSQMAEAIAYSLKKPQFVFSSAGLAPHPIAEPTTRFMAQKGIDLSRTVAKSVERIPNFEHYQIIIALSPGARRLLPTRLTKTVGLDWQIPDPSATAGSEAQVAQAYETAFQFLTHNLQDLLAAMLGKETDSQHQD